MQDDNSCIALCARALKLAEAYEFHGSALWIGLIASSVATGAFLGAKFLKSERERAGRNANHSFLYRHKDTIATGAAALIGAIPAITTTLLVLSPDETKIKGP